MVKEIPKNNEIYLLIKLIECKRDMADLYAFYANNKKDGESENSKKEAYNEILGILRSLLPEVEIS